MQYWKRIGNVRVVYPGVQSFFDYKLRRWSEYKEIKFNSLKEAVKWMGLTKINTIKYERLPVMWADPVEKPLISVRIKGDDFVVKDECDLIIPKWRLLEEINNIPNQEFIENLPKWYISRYNKTRTKYIKNRKN